MTTEYAKTFVEMNLSREKGHFPFSGEGDSLRFLRGTMLTIYGAVVRRIDTLALPSPRYAAFCAIVPETYRPFADREQELAAANLRRPLMDRQYQFVAMCHPDFRGKGLNTVSEDGDKQQMQPIDWVWNSGCRKDAVSGLSMVASPGAALGRLVDR